MNGSKWKLMTDNAISQEDKRRVADFVLSSSGMTMGENVKLFERKWSEWLGCKYSVFVNSGSSANLILADAMRNFGAQNAKWVCPAITWATSVSPIRQLGMRLQLCDVSMDLGLDLDCLEEVCDRGDVSFLFLTHLLGFSSISDRLLEIVNKYNLILLEDCCECHGSDFGGKKLGTFGTASTFSFYYGHHMTTIEGGMVCTDSEALYHCLLLLRSHGLVRELPPEFRKAKEVEGVDPKFTFAIHGYNVRNTEIAAVLGLSQLERLDSFIEIRKRNLVRYMERVSKAYHHFPTEGVSSFSIPIYCKNSAHKTKVVQMLDAENIESRPIVGGNLYLQPFMGNTPQDRYDKNADSINSRGIYIGNHQDVTTEMVDRLCDKLNKISEE